MSRNKCRILGKDRSEIQACTQIAEGRLPAADVQPASLGTFDPVFMLLNRLLSGNKGVGLM